MSSKRSALIFLIFVVGCILFLWLIFGGGKNSGTKKDAPKAFNLVEYVDKNSSVAATTHGRINGDDEHRAVRVTITANNRLVEIIQGYEGKVIDSKSYPNNAKAYKAFLNALSKTGYGKVRKSTVASEEGVCATGRRFTYDLRDSDKLISHTWTANCVKGNAPVSPENVSNLFRRQITDYDEITRNVRL